MKGFARILCDGARLALLFILLACFFRGLFTGWYWLSGVCIVVLFFVWYQWGWP